MQMSEAATFFLTMNGEHLLNDSNICRDFLRNVCNRGVNCKFRHPEGDEAKALGKKELVFCHDYQNKECRRVTCRFVHCTKQEEEMYRSSGYISEFVLESQSIRGGTPAVTSTIPVCKDYMKGECKRGNRCKFRHISAAQYLPDTLNNNNAITRKQQTQQQQQLMAGFEQNYEPQSPFPMITAENQKRFEDNFSPFSSASTVQDPLPTPQSFLTQHVRMLQDENGRLLHKIEELKKQVVELTATNQFLRDQNEHIRGLATKDWYLSSYQNSYLQ